MCRRRSPQWPGPVGPRLGRDESQSAGPRAMNHRDTETQRKQEKEDSYISFSISVFSSLCLCGSDQLLDRRRVADDVGRPAVRRVQHLAGVDAQLLVNRRCKVFWRQDALDGAVALSVG